MPEIIEVWDGDGWYPVQEHWLDLFIGRVLRTSMWPGVVWSLGLCSDGKTRYPIQIAGVWTP